MTSIVVPTGSVSTPNDFELFSSRQISGLVGGVLGGISTAVVTYPIGVIKLKMATQTADKPINGLWDAIVKIRRWDGVGRFYRGSSGNFFRSGLLTGLFFYTAAAIQDALMTQRYRSSPSSTNQHTTTILNLQPSPTVAEITISGMIIGALLSPYLGPYRMLTLYRQYDPTGSKNGWLSGYRGIHAKYLNLREPTRASSTIRRDYMLSLPSDVIRYGVWLGGYAFLKSSLIALRPQTGLPAWITGAAADPNQQLQPRTHLSVPESYAAGWCVGAARNWVCAPIDHLRQQIRWQENLSAPALQVWKEALLKSWKYRSLIYWNQTNVAYAKSAPTSAICFMCVELACRNMKENNGCTTSDL